MVSGERDAEEDQMTSLHDMNARLRAQLADSEARADSHVTDLEVQVDGLKEQVSYWERKYTWAAKNWNKQEDQVAALREALEFYAHPGVYNWEVARDALGKFGEESSK